MKVKIVTCSFDDVKGMVFVGASQATNSSEMLLVFKDPRLGGNHCVYLAIEIGDVQSEDRISHDEAYVEWETEKLLDLGVISKEEHHGKEIDGLLEEIRRINREIDEKLQEIKGA